MELSADLRAGLLIFVPFFSVIYPIPFWESIVLYARK